MNWLQNDETMFEPPCCDNRSPSPDNYFQCGDMSPSTSDWLQRGFEVYDNFGLESKVTNMSAKFPDEESNSCGQFLYKEVGNACREASLSDPIARVASSSNQRVPEGGLDYQQCEDMERTDDIFLGEFFEGGSLDANMPYSSMSFENLLSEMLADPQSSMKEDSCESDVQLTEDGIFSSSISDKLSLSRMILAPGHEEDCLEAALLQEIEDITIKLTLKTRICLRDALYRLAGCSRQHSSIDKNDSVKDVMDDPFGIASEDGSLSIGRMKFTETKTNALDRTIANLMFSH